jgi:hypothetical protein
MVDRRATIRAHEKLDDRNKRYGVGAGKVRTGREKTGKPDSKNGSRTALPLSWYKLQICQISLTASTAGKTSNRE